jgi:hypothetical protein
VLVCRVDLAVWIRAKRSVQPRFAHSTMPAQRFYFETLFVNSQHHATHSLRTQHNTLRGVSKHEHNKLCSPPHHTVT